MAPNYELTKDNLHNLVNLIFEYVLFMVKILMVEEVSIKKRTGDREKLEKSTNTVCSGKCHNDTLMFMLTIIGVLR